MYVEPSCFRGRFPGPRLSNTTNTDTWPVASSLTVEPGEWSGSLFLANRTNKLPFAISLAREPLLKLWREHLRGEVSSTIRGGLLTRTVEPR